MTILYEFIAGDAPCLWGAIVCWVFAVFFLGLLIFSMREGEDGLACCCVVLLVFCTVIGFCMCADKQRPAVQALIDDKTPWVEINNQYEFVRQEGEIYTFYVREDATNE